MLGILTTIALVAIPCVLLYFYCKSNTEKNKKWPNLDLSYRPRHGNYSHILSYRYREQMKEEVRIERKIREENWNKRMKKNRRQNHGRAPSVPVNTAHPLHRPVVMLRSSRKIGLPIELPFDEEMKQYNSQRSDILNILYRQAFLPKQRMRPPNYGVASQNVVYSKKLPRKCEWFKYSRPTTQMYPKYTADYKKAQYVNVYALGREVKQQRPSQILDDLLKQQRAKQIHDDLVEQQRATHILQDLETKFGNLSVADPLDNVEWEYYPEIYRYEEEMEWEDYPEIYRYDYPEIYRYDYPEIYRYEEEMEWEESAPVVVTAPTAQVVVTAPTAPVVAALPTTAPVVAALPTTAPVVAALPTTAPAAQAASVGFWYSEASKETSSVGAIRVVSSGSLTRLPPLSLRLERYELFYGPICEITSNKMWKSGMNRRKKEKE